MIIKKGSSAFWKIDAYGFGSLSHRIMDVQREVLIGD